MSLSGFVGRALRVAVWVLIAAGLVVFGWIWLIADRSGQEKMMMTVPLLVVVGVLAVVALVTVRGPWRRSARGVAAVLVAIGVAMPVLFRLKGLTGDFFPVLEYRFAPKHDTTLPGLPGAARRMRLRPLTQSRRREVAKARRTIREPRNPTLQHPPPPRLRRADPALQDPALQDPALQDPALQDPALQDPALQDPALPHLALQHPALRHI